MASAGPSTKGQRRSFDPRRVWIAGHPSAQASAPFHSVPAAWQEFSRPLSQRTKNCRRSQSGRWSSAPPIPTAIERRSLSVQEARPIPRRVRRKLSGLTPEEVRRRCRRTLDMKKEFPEWKIEFIRKNREFYKKHKRLIDKWLPSITRFSPSFQKLEWNVRAASAASGNTSSASAHPASASRSPPPRLP